MKSALVLPWLPPLRTRLDMGLYENPWILGPCTQQTISCPFKVHRALVPCFLSCNVKYPVFLTCKTTAALYTFSPGLTINKGVFPSRQFVSLPSHPEWSVQLYSQCGLLWHSTVRKCPEQLCLELTSLTGSQCLVESCNAGLTPPLEQDSLFPSPLTTDPSRVKTGEAVLSGMGWEAGNWKQEAQPLLLSSPLSSSA